ncbi:MAG: AsmA family protein [Rhodospirillales bacterium]|nr:AsmA family protein [Rhodospirillales bacterium]
MRHSRSSGSRLLRWILFGVLGILILAVVAVVAFVATFDANAYKPRIIAAVRQATGRDLILAGPIGLKLSLHPAIEATDVALANPPGFSRPDMAKLGALDLGLDLTALLSGRIEVSRLTLVRPDILLERNKAGATNWSFAPAAAKPAPAAAPNSAPAPAASSSLPIFIREVRITDGHLGYRDDATGKATTVALASLAVTEASPDAPLALNATATVNGAPVRLAGQTGPLAALTGTNSAPWPVKLTLAAAGATLGLDGGIAHPAAASGIALALNAAIPDLAALSPIAGSSLPALKGLALTGKLSVPDTLAKGGRIEALALTLPGGRITGALGFRIGAVPDVSGTLSSPSLDADALLAALHGPAAPAPAHPAGGGGAAAPASPYLIPTTPLPLGALRAADADLTVSVAALKTGGEVWHDLAFHLLLKGGRLNLAPFSASPPAGKFALTLMLDAARPVPPLSFTLHAPGLALASLLKMAGESGLATGAVALDADIHGAGASPHAIAAGLTGTIVATMQGGTIDNATVNRMFGPMLAKANLSGLLAHGGTSRIECLAARLSARNGAAQLQPFLFASSLSTIDGDGTMNLGAETLNLTFRPQARAGGTGIAVPVAVGGTFAHPSYGLNQGAVAQAGVGAALSLLQGGKLAVPGSLQAKPVSCAASLAEARGQRPPAGTAAPSTAPTPAQKPAAPNPGSLLRGLFH